MDWTCPRNNARPNGNMLKQRAPRCSRLARLPLAGPETLEQAVPQMKWTHERPGPKLFQVVKRSLYQDVPISVALEEERKLRLKAPSLRA